MESASPFGTHTSSISTGSPDRFPVDPCSQSVSGKNVHIRVDPVPKVDEYELSECFSSSKNNVHAQREKNFLIVQTYYKSELRQLTRFLSLEVVDLSERLRDGKEPFILCPAVAFCLHQYLLSISELLLRLEKRKISYRNFREIAENLAALLECYHSKALIDASSRVVATVLSNRLANLFEKWDVVAMVLEDVFQKQMTDWCELAQISRKKYPRATLKSLRSPKETTISLSHFSKPIHIGRATVGSSYLYFLTQLGQTTLLMRIRTLAKKKTRSIKLQRELRMEAIMCTRLKHPLLARPLATALVDHFFVSFADIVPSVGLSLLLDSAPFADFGLSLEVTRLILAQLGVATTYLHCAGFIHRDIRPENVYVSAFCRVKLLCPEQPKVCVGAFTSRRFGGFFRSTAHEFTDHEMPPNHFLHLRPPEIIRGFPYGRSIDWWLLGVMAFWMYYHKMPFRRRRDKRTISAVLKGCPRMNRTNVIGFKHLKDFIYKAVNPKPKTRLCCKSYSEFFTHPLFEGMNWNIIEKYNMFIELFEVEDLFELQVSPSTKIASAAEVTSCFRMLDRQDSHQAVPDMSKTTNLSMPCVSYTSPVLLRAIEKANAEESMLSLMWTDEEQEWIDPRLFSPEDLANKPPYKFNKFFKATRVPRETISDTTSS